VLGRLPEIKAGRNFPFPKNKRKKSERDKNSGKRIDKEKEVVDKTKV
jgi:hypothetical protein